MRTHLERGRVGFSKPYHEVGKDQAWRCATIFSRKFRTRRSGDTAGRKERTERKGGKKREFAHCEERRGEDVDFRAPVQIEEKDSYIWERHTTSACSPLYP